MTFLMPWFSSFSSAINIKARDLPDAGGALISKYCAEFALNAICCISRIPWSLVFLLVPV